jgi:hypothetical protein
MRDIGNSYIFVNIKQRTANAITDSKAKLPDHTPCPWVRNGTADLRKITTSMTVPIIKRLILALALSSFLFSKTLFPSLQRKMISSAPNKKKNEAMKSPGSLPLLLIMPIVVND